MKAMDLAAHIINRGIQIGSPVSNLQLQKIMYFVNLFHVKQKNGNLLIEDEEFEAWQFGPVIRSVYQKYSIYVANPISITQEYSKEFVTQNDTLLNRLIDALIKQSPWKLVEWSHAPDGAWAKTYLDGIGNKEIIPSDLIVKEANGVL